MTYFESLVETTSNTKFANDLPMSAFMMLKRYDKLNAESLGYFQKYKESNNKLREFYWKRSCEVDYRAKAMLDAYEILTARKVNTTPYAVRQEMQWLNKTFDLGY